MRTRVRVPGARSMESKPFDPRTARTLLARARLYLIFTPRLCGERDPLEVLWRVLPWVDLIQVRPKAAPHGQDPLRPTPASAAASEARETWEWCRRVLQLVRAGGRDVPVIANDRVDVAMALRDEGLAGVHLGQDDTPPSLARRLLGPDALIGLSTHSAAQVVRAEEEPCDYLGFGPFRASATKGYSRGLGAEACWLAQEASSLPVFPIGGIDVESVGELERVGRAAVGSAILSNPDPAAAARTIAGLLEQA
jgi:thiamine-phosphate pyrophosphorylase